MARNDVLTFSATPETVKQLARLQAETGLTRSEILRRIIELAASKGRGEIDLAGPWIAQTDKNTLLELASKLKEVAVSIESST